MNSREMPETDCRDPAHVLIFVTGEGNALPLDPLPIWVIVRSTEKCICDLCTVAAAKEDLDLWAASFHHCFVSHFLLVSSLSL